MREGEGEKGEEKGKGMEGREKRTRPTSCSGSVAVADGAVQRGVELCVQAVHRPLPAVPAGGGAEEEEGRAEGEGKGGWGGDKGKKRGAGEKGEAKMSSRKGDRREGREGGLSLKMLQLVEARPRPSYLRTASREPHSAAACRGVLGGGIPSSSMPVSDEGEERREGGTEKRREGGRERKW